MKLKFTSLLPFSVFAISALLLTTSCKKDNKSGASAQFSGTIGTTSFQPTQVLGIASGGYVGIAGLQLKNGDTLTFAVTVPDTAKVGQTILFSPYADGEVDYYNTKGTIDYTSFTGYSHGTITISSWDKTNKKIAGNFTGVIYSFSNSDDSTKVSGQFNSTYLQP
jgi:hypothetical protein